MQLLLADDLREYLERSCGLEGGLRMGHAISIEPWLGRKGLGGTHHLVSGLEYASAKRIVQSLDSHEGV